jgi:hypothetical protein
MSKSIPHDIDLKADAKNAVGDLTKAIEASRKMIALMAEIARDEEALEAKKALLHQLESQELPEVFDSCGTDTIPLGQGLNITIKPITKASLPSAGAIEKEKNEDKKEEMIQRKEAGLDWLRKNGGESLIKNFLNLEFSKGMDNKVKSMIAQAEEMGIAYQKETSVHNSSLESFIKEKIAAGKKVPMDTFSIYTGRKAVLVKPKKSKKG